MTMGLEVIGLSAGYDSANVLENINLTAEPGEITCLLGSNGAGKTTFIRSLLSLTKVRTGRVIFRGKDITGWPPHRIVALGIGCIPEGRKVFSKLSVEENLRMGAYLETRTSEIRRRIEECFEIFPRLRERRTQLAGTLSGGEQAMVSISRGLMGAPHLLLIDEPSLGLSPRFVSETFRVVRQVCQRGIAVFLVEQNVRQTLAIAKHGFVLSKGKIIAQGTSTELLQCPEVSSAYFGEDCARDSTPVKVAAVSSPR